MSKSRGPVKKLMDKDKTARSEFANGSFKRWSENKLTSRKNGSYDEHDHRAGGPAVVHDYQPTRELAEIYRKYVAVYDKVSTTRRRTTYYRRPATVMVELNSMFAAGSRRSGG